jgi:heptosyltransferase-1
LQTQSKFRLLVVRLGAMGDILHALPAVTALRKAHPSWVIDWVVEPRWRALLSAESATTRDTTLQPIVDRLHLAPTKEWRRKPLAADTLHQVLQLQAGLRQGQYDVVLDLQGSIRSAIFGRIAGARRRVGESDPREHPARWFFTERIATRGAHVIEQDIELAAAIAGDALEPVQPSLPVDPVAEAWATELVGTSSQPIALINPGAGWGAKRWPPERYAAVARALALRGLRVLINAGPGEVALAGEIAHQSGGTASVLAPSLDQLIAVTRCVALVIAGDTGPLHLACALGKPVVGIYGPTDPSRNGPFGVPFRILRSPQSRRDHTRREAPEAGLLTIQPDDVLRAAVELLYPEASA